MSADVPQAADNEPIFANLDADDPDKGTMEIESLCQSCESQGMTRLMLTRIPYFREIILSSFQCDKCNYSNRHVQYGGKLQEKGIKYEVCIKNSRDMDRQVIKSEFATFKIPHLDFEQPPTKTGEITTVEGLLDNVIQGLSHEQPLRRALDAELAKKIEQFISRLEKLKTLSEPFSIVFDDPSGNTFVENPYVPDKDTEMTMSHYVRSPDQHVLLGLQPSTGNEDAIVEEPDDRGSNDTGGNSQEPDPENLKDEVLSFPTNCPACGVPCDTKMKVLDIPFFKEVVIMATACDACGNRENEVKGGSGIEDQGTRITLKVTDPSDLNRDVLKSDTCAVVIPEIELELTEGTLGGRFTTIEGLLVQIKEQLKSSNPFFMGDSATGDSKAKIDVFLEKLDALITGNEPRFTFVLDDAAGNSYLQNLYAPEADPEMTIEKYTRSRDQDETLGLLDMNTENYADS